MSIESVKVAADRLAEANAVYINQRAPLVGVKMVVLPNYKFFRRLAGLSGSDLVKIPELS